MAGTTVPLEKNTVRFVDNFSGGMRGAVTAELLVEAGYAVVFLHRRRSTMPFVRWLQDEAALLSFEPGADGASVVLRDGRACAAVAALARAPLLPVAFVSVHDYLHLFRALACLLDSPRALVYACAAVSDFYIPAAQMAQHKIQSRGAEAGLTLHLSNVPKLLGRLRAAWCPRAVIVTFKLETDATLLEAKAAASLRAYGQDLVVGNLLASYRHRVCLRFADGRAVDVASEEEAVENKFVPLIVDYHTSKLA